jgi:phospholipase C
MLVVSPWSKGGWVNSEVFDHTALIRFVEKRFGTAKSPLSEPNITAWRGAVCGDLTSAFNFATPNGATAALPSTAAYVPPDDQRHQSYIPLPPVVQSLPVQEPGIRPARAVPYVLNVNAAVSLTAGEFALEFLNTGKKTAVFQVRSGSALQPPRSYTVTPNSQLSDVWDAGVGLGGYDLSVYGPNGFFRAYKGSVIGATSANIQTTIAYDVAHGGVTLTALNSGTAACQLQVLNVYTSETVAKELNAGAMFQQFFSLQRYYGWYDLVLTVEEDPVFRQQFAGHLETGKDSTTDPAIPAK